MESVDSSPSLMMVTKIEDSAEYDDIISFSSSSCGSAVNGPYVPKSNSAIKYRTSNKKLLRNARSIRRRAKSRLIHPSIEMSNDFLADESQASPNYLKATSSSEGKKSNFQASPRYSGSFYGGSEQNSSHSSQSKLFSPSVRNVGILLKKSTSFKPKRSLLSYTRVSEDVAVDRATYSSTLKDSKFPKAIEIHSEGKELEGDPAMKVCRYHHCSLHGHCHGSEETLPPPKHSQYKKRRALKKQKSMTPKRESTNGNKRSSDKKKNIQKNQINYVVEPLAQETKSGGVVFSVVESNSVMGSYAEIPSESKALLYGDERSDLQDFDLAEIAFGETSFPERSYQENLNIMRKYSPREQDFGGSRIYGYCLKCSCSIKEQIMPPSEYADADLSVKQVTASSIGTGYSHEIPQIRDVHVADARSFILIQEPKEQDISPVKDIETFDKGYENEGFHENFPETPVLYDKLLKNNGGFSTASDIQTTSDSNSEGDGESTTESTIVKNSKESEVVQVKDNELDSPTPKGSKLQFSNQRHVSMWHLIHQRMSSDLAAEVVNQPQQGAEGEIQVDAPSSVPAEENSASEKAFSGSDIDTDKNGSETQEIELRKLFAIKLVREAIEKILLPEIQDQTSDDQSNSGGSTPRPELIKENETDASVRENSGESIAEKEEKKVPSNPKDENIVSDVTYSPDNPKTGKKIAGIFEKKAPKHWSNLKKWILLQRFIRELEKVRKFNPRKPELLPLSPDPEAEKVKLRAQTLDERKKAEEWMLDYALRQAVSQLAPTQKKKVALLVKAFETVVPSHEEPQIQYRIPTVEHNSLDRTGYKVLEPVPEEDGENEEEVSPNGKAELPSDDKTSSLESETQERGAILADCSENASGSNEVCGEPVVTNQRSSEEILEETKVMEKSIVSSNQEPEELDCGNGEESSATRSLINGNVKSVVSKESLYSASHSDTQLEQTLTDSSGIKDANKAYKTVLDREKHFRMWHMIYHHVVTGIAEKVGSTLLDGSDDDETEDNRTAVTNSSDDFSNSNDQPITESHALSDHKSGFTKSDALKLVKEAVDEILIPEIPEDDTSDTQSITSDFDPGLEMSERERKVSSENKYSSDDTIPSVEERPVELSIKTKSALPRLKNWSKLKKLILLKRSIRALEKATKVKPKEQSSVPEKPDGEQEKIDLRHQMSDERNKAEQWMLDYAVQHIVTKLTPARKKRVATLVEAFEAVVPLPEN